MWRGFKSSEKRRAFFRWWRHSATAARTSFRLTAGPAHRHLSSTLFANFVTCLEMRVRMRWGLLRKLFLPIYNFVVVLADCIHSYISFFFWLYPMQSADFLWSVLLVYIQFRFLGVVSFVVTESWGGREFFYYHLYFVLLLFSQYLTKRSDFEARLSARYLSFAIK